MRKLLAGLLIGLALGGMVATGTMAMTAHHEYQWIVGWPDETPFTDPARIQLDGTIADGVVVGKVFDETGNGYIPVKLFIRSDLVIFGAPGE